MMFLNVGGNFVARPPARIATLRQHRSPRLGVRPCSPTFVMCCVPMCFPCRLDAVDYGDGSLLKNCQAPQSLTLKVGAQVILLKNLSQEEGLVNGARGIVVAFRRSQDPEADDAVLPAVRFGGNGVWRGVGRG
jgi:hypothetical protein